MSHSMRFCGMSQPVRPMGDYLNKFRRPTPYNSRKFRGSSLPLGRISVCRGELSVALLAQISIRAEIVCSPMRMNIR